MINEKALEAAISAICDTGLLDGDECRSAARAAIQAYLGALDGVVLVPVEPDIYMGDAGFGALDQDADCTCCAYEVYRAMIAARPPIADVKE